MGGVVTKAQEAFNALTSKAGAQQIPRLTKFKDEVRILMVGLDAAGKTTILYKLKLGEVEWMVISRY